ncbi:MAG: diaminopimelate decarboxylase [Christensenellales bacterium]|jgi:diaminopimelate decarboxylase
MKNTPFTKEQIESIISKYPTPFHLYDEKGIRENARRLNKAFSWNKGFKEYYAVKANPNPFIINILKEEGCGVDCSSYTELLLADRTGFKESEIMFSSNATPAEEYKLARELNATINLDDITHIEFLEKNGGIPEVISCRYNPGGEFYLGNMVMGTPGEAKYGFTREQLSRGFKMLIEKGAKVFGLHAFLASNVTDPRYYPSLAKKLFNTAVELRDETGADIRFINLSGGIGIPYLPDEDEADIESISENVKKAYDETIKPAGMEVAIYSELGRYMTGPYGYLISTAIHQKDTYKQYIGLDSCAADLMRPAMYGAYHHITVMGKENMANDHKYDVTGSLCENNDKFAVDRMLPKIDVGDIIVIHDTGAHGYAMGYNYNGKLRSAEILLKEDGSSQLIRRAENEKDYFATFDFTGMFDGI